MKQNIGEVMTPNPKTLAQSATIMEAACAMRDNDIGDVVILDNGRLYIVNDNEERSFIAAFDDGAFAALEDQARFDLASLTAAAQAPTRLGDNRWACSW